MLCTLAFRWRLCLCYCVQLWQEWYSLHLTTLKFFSSRLLPKYSRLRQREPILEGNNMIRTWTPDTDTPKPDGTDFRAVKAWLNRYREAEKRYYLLSDRLAEAQEATRHITQSLSAAPSGSKDGQSLARAVEREEEAERRAYEQRAVCDRLFLEIKSALDRIRNEKAYTVLYKYYLDCLTWDRVAKDMNYSLRMVYVLRRKAMEELSL
nr:MAG TPA: Protein of unknown function (DUF722) [Caudoviricetes sp.]